MGKTKTIEQVIQDIEENVDAHSDKEDKEFKSVCTEPNRWEVRRMTWEGKDIPEHVHSEIENVFKNTDIPNMSYGWTCLTENLDVFKYHSAIIHCESKTILLLYTQNNVVYSILTTLKKVLKDV